MSLFARIKTFIGNLRLRERMLFIYIAGGILPILLLDIYTYQNTRSVLIQKAKESEMDGLNMIADSMSESMSVISDISKQMYFDEKIEHIAFHQYENYSEILADYRDYDTISDYLKYYYHEISSITLYLNNDTISNNEYFVHVDQEIAEKPWYQNTLELNGKPYWSYSYDSLKRKDSLRMSRLLYTKDMQLVGVLAINMQYKRTELPVQERTQDTYLVYNDTVVLHRNEYERDTDEMILLLKQIKDDTYSGKVRFQGEDTCLLSTVRVKPDYSDDYYTLVSVCPYEEIAGSAARSALGSLVPQLVCVVSGLGIILVFSNQFSTRVNTFRLQMHKAATGDFDITEDIGGEDEISDLYRDLKVMIDSIQELMNNVIKERVQKEQVNARQKEVEFKMLASQINPHFLYNTLETIRMQARIHNQPDIEELAKMLAKIMRRNIQVSHKLVSLQSEIELIDNYMRIQDYRFGDRIHSEIVVDDDVDMTQEVMPLIIQPFVENAFIHGLENKPKDGRLEVKVSQDEKDIIIEVIDNGTGMNYYQLGELRHSLTQTDGSRGHIGISNVNQRLIMQYGKEYAVKVDSRLNDNTDPEECFDSNRAK
jgi:two-component system sensor histidine kinase YesM